jgi:Flp pilus assembly protein TadD
VQGQTDQAVAAEPWNVHFQDGIAHYQAGRLAEAVDSFRQVTVLQPGVMQAHVNLGLILRMLGRREEAVAPLYHVARNQPGHADAVFHLGTTLQELRRVNEALQVMLHLVSFRPDYPSAQLTLGNIYMSCGQSEAAERHYRLAVVYEPDSATATNNLGASLLSQCRVEDAPAPYRRAIRLEPTSPEYHKNLGCARLMASDFPEGWAEYEWRYRQTVWKWNRQFPGIPEWDGGPLAGKTILVHFEQGLGDSFQFVRYASVLKAMGARVVFECQPAVKRVLSTAPDIDVLVAHGEPLPPFDCYIPLMSLMHRLGTTIDTIPGLGSVPGAVPYVFAEPQRIEAWRRRMGEGEFRIGINWHANEVAKSIPLEEFVPIAAIPGVRLYSLQKVKGLDQLDGLRDRLPLVDWSAEMDAGPDGFVDTAAVMASMDLIVTCDTSVGHLAGALGVRTWMPLKWFADWRWLRDRLDCPWYPTMRLFRMARKDDWPGMMAEVTAELTRLVAEERGR